MSANFQTDLKRGQAGEKLYHKLRPELTRLSGRYADFIDDNGMTYEIKTDSYDTPNFFMERWSDVANKKAGGPWQSSEKEIDFYVYLFPKKGKGYIFTVSSLLEQLNNIATPNQRYVQNKSWMTVGWLVPILSLTPDAEFSLAKSTK